MAHGLIEAQTAAVEEDLVNVGGTETAVDGADSLVADDDADAVDGSSVVVRLVAFVLELALQLHAARRKSGQPGTRERMASVFTES